jgi:signal transduction histidine kinase
VSAPRFDSLKESVGFLLDRIRLRLTEIARAQPEAGPALAAVDQILDRELAVMLETYRQDSITKSRGAERLATVGHFAASIGHELRNPLAVIESSLFLLRQQLGPPIAEQPGVAKHLARIGDEIASANKTIHDLLDLARHRPPRRTRTGLCELIEIAEGAALLPKGVRVRASGIPPDLAIDVDPDQFRQVFVNLFTNAAQAMAGQGTIDLMADRPSEVTRIRVRDEGPGVADDVRHRLFEVLFTTKAKGTGLGLPLCRRILEAHGGTIELEPGGTGATFLITLPNLPAATRA